MNANHADSTPRLNANLRPMPVWESLLYFAAITLLMLFCFYGVRPYLEQLGLNGYPAYLLSLSMVGVVMLVWTFITLAREGNLKNREVFLNRLRLGGFNPGMLGWSVGLGLVMFLSTAIFSPLISKLVSDGLLPIPDQIPDYINPLKQLSISHIKNQLISQGVVMVLPVVLLLNIFGEEFFWRGIVLPRQQLRHGKSTFLIHGLIWAFTHLFQYWLIFPILIGSLALSYVIQRTKNTWIGILAHLMNNALPFLIMIFIP